MQEDPLGAAGGATCIPRGHDDLQKRRYEWNIADDAVTLR